MRMRCCASADLKSKKKVMNLYMAIWDAHWSAKRQTTMPAIRKLRVRLNLSIYKSSKNDKFNPRVENVGSGEIKRDGPNSDQACKSRLSGQPCVRTMHCSSDPSHRQEKTTRGDFDVPDQHTRLPKTLKIKLNADLLVRANGLTLKREA